MVRLVFCLWLAVRGFTLSQRQATSKVSIGIFVRFPLASSAGRSAHTVGLLPPAATLRKKLVYQLAQQAHGGGVAASPWTTIYGAAARQHKSVVTTAGDHDITYHNHNENIPCGL